MFFKCPNCQKVWQYPLELCPECFLRPERQESKKIKVIGISEVKTPTIFHPQVPYFVLLLEDENKNRWVQKSIKEYKIGDEFIIPKTEDKKAVAVWRARYDIFGAIKKIMGFLGPLKITAQSKILILPTLNSATHPFLCENTSPQFLEALIQYLLAEGAKKENIKVTGQSFDQTPIEVSSQKSQLLGVCQKLGVFPFDLSRGEFLQKEKNGFTFEISKEVFEADIFLNLPILKISDASATKNLLKVLKKENYLRLTYLHSEKEIIKNFLSLLPEVFTLADANFVQKPDKFVVFVGLVLASFDSLNLDRVFAEITMSKDLTEPLKEIKIENVPIVGRQIKEVGFEIEKYGAT